MGRGEIGAVFEVEDYVEELYEYWYESKEYGYP